MAGWGLKLELVIRACTYYRVVWWLHNTMQWSAEWPWIINPWNKITHQNHHIVWHVILSTFPNIVIQCMSKSQHMYMYLPVVAWACLGPTPSATQSAAAQSLSARGQGSSEPTWSAIESHSPASKAKQGKAKRKKIRHITPWHNKDTPWYTSSICSDR